MTNPLSVLLIIGASAVAGPIDAPNWDAAISFCKTEAAKRGIKTGYEGGEVAYLVADLGLQTFDAALGLHWRNSSQYIGTTEFRPLADCIIARRK